ncbi:unnamed protein product [Effrenium voratum]|nr:unnamed protein product [Effrenium voratum]
MRPSLPGGKGMNMRMPMGMPMMGLPMMGMPMMGMPMMGMPMMNMPMMQGMNQGQGQVQGQVQGAQGKASAPAPAAAGSAPGSQSAPAGTMGAEVRPEVLERKEHLLHDLHVAARELAHKHEEKRRDRSRSRDDHRQGGSSHQAPPPPVEEAPKEEEVKEEAPPPCHLHPAKKPNAKCKFCQRAAKGCAKAAPKKPQEARERSAADAKEHKEAERDTDQGVLASKKKDDDEEDYSRRTFNCSPILKDQILGSSYFKSVLQLTNMDEIIAEIKNYADTLDVYNPGSSTAPSNFICQVYRIFTLPEAEDLSQLQVVLDSPTAIVRCAGFVYLRFVVPAAKLFDKLEEYLFDDMKLSYQEGGRTVNTTIGEYVEALIGREKYFNRPLPRVPVKVKQQLERELAPMSEYRKRMEAHTKSSKKIAGTPVEVIHDGRWLPGTAVDFAGKVVKGRKVKVDLENGQEVTVHTGKVVLRGDAKAEDKDREKDKEEKEKDEARSGSEDEGKKKRKRKSRSRSRSRRRSRSPSLDWCRHKGSHDKDLLEALRERAREEAVCSYSKTYSRRPTEDESRRRDHHPDSRAGDKSRSDKDGGEFRSKLRQEEEEEHKRRMRDIYEKYGNIKAAPTNYAAGAISSQAVV